MKDSHSLLHNDLFLLSFVLALNLFLISHDQLLFLDVSFFLCFGTDLVALFLSFLWSTVYKCVENVSNIACGNIRGGNNSRKSVLIVGKAINKGQVKEGRSKYIWEGSLRKSKSFGIQGSVRYLQDEAAHLLDLFLCRLVVHVCEIPSENSQEKKKELFLNFLFFIFQ